MKSLPHFGCLALLLYTFPSHLALAAVPAPKLTGIIRLEKNKLALLELSEGSSLGLTVVREPILHEGDRDGIYEVRTIDEKSAKVTLRVDTEIELKLEQAPGEALANRTLNLQSAKLEQVLDVYKNLAGRTIIRPSNLPAVRLDLRSGAALSDADAAAVLARGFGEKGLFLEPRGDKFILLVPKAQESQASSIPDPPGSETGPTQDLIPPGLIKFQQTDLLQVLDIYSELTGRTVLRPQSLPSGRISGRNQTVLTREEAVWMIEALCAMEGVAMVPESEKFVFALPAPVRKKLPKFNPKDASAKATRILRPGSMKFQDADLATLLNTYAELLGRKPLPIDKPVPHATFSLRTPNELSQPAAIFALEAVAAVNNLRLELVGEDQVRIAAAAAP